jgi:predicted DNA-binding protein
MSQRKDDSSIFTGVRMPVDLRRQAEQRAAEDGRTLSNYIKNLIRKDLGEVQSESAKKKAVKKRSSG